MAQGYNKTVSSTKAVAPTMDTSGLFKEQYNKSVNATGANAKPNVDIEINIDEYMDIEIKPEEPKKAWYEQLWDATGEFFSDVGKVLASTGATIAVGATSIISGIADIGEAIVDGGAWVVSAGASIIGQKEFAQDVRGFISRDLVGEANKAFYENTSVGQAINDASYMKYDSDVAQGIREITTDVAELAAATALTIVSGGAAAPLVVGTIYGLGNAAESTYQNKGTDTSALQEIKILGSGALEGISWMANGQLGVGMVEIGKDVSSIGAKQLITDFANSAKTKQFWIDSAKYWGKTFKEGAIGSGALENHVKSTMMTAESVIPYITGDEQFDATSAIKLVGKYAESLTLNIVTSGIKDNISAYRSSSTPPGGGNSDSLLRFLTDSTNSTIPIPPKGEIEIVGQAMIDSSDFTDAIIEVLEDADNTTI